MSNDKKRILVFVVFWILLVVLIVNAVFITNRNKQDGTASKTIIVNDTTTTKAE